EETVEEETNSVEAPTPAAENGVITADEWEAVYPDQVASFKANAENTYRVSYIEEDPYIVTLYEGYGFAKDYGSAIGHEYTLQDVAETKRPHPLANCLTCKTPDFTKLVNDLGVEVYKMDFEEVMAQMTQNISCYNCHANDVPNLAVTHSYVTNALGSAMEGINAEVLACGQCHIEYYFDPETKETMMPYDSVEAMDPEAIYAYYTDQGFSDWTCESTGTGMIKAQHPEMETFLGEGSVHKGMLSCADCHMETVTKDDGSTFKSHTLVSPLQSEAILETCAACHKDTDMKEKVATIQEEITARETEIGTQLETLHNDLAKAVADGSLDEATLAEVQALYREAQWYWDFIYVENSEGAHNSTMSRRCLDKAEELLAKANELF
ncbi:MAG: ammonia-forming cytochrome c nitrite reductase subunit c552, partial [Erysipelotrichaceae bacterium]|nr:ammonia-forming cytochrome c nitrite reductase subunit c552 [Erysipelotrichaceae bacterium]